MTYCSSTRRSCRRSRSSRRTWVLTWCSAGSCTGTAWGKLHITQSGNNHNLSEVDRDEERVTYAQFRSMSPVVDSSFKQVSCFCGKNWVSQVESPLNFKHALLGFSKPYKVQSWLVKPRTETFWQISLQFFPPVNTERCHYFFQGCLFHFVIWFLIQSVVIRF